MTKLHDQISAQLAPGEHLLAVAPVRRPDDARRAGWMFGLIGLLIGNIISDARRAKEGATLAGRIEHHNHGYAVVTSHRVVFFKDHTVKLHQVGEKITEFGRHEIVGAVPIVRRVVDSQVEFAFVDGSTCAVTWRKKRDLSPWIEGMQQFLATPSPVPSGYAVYSLPSFEDDRPVRAGW